MNCILCETVTGTVLATSASSQDVTLLPPSTFPSLLDAVKRSQDDMMRAFHGLAAASATATMADDEVANADENDDDEEDFDAGRF